MYALANKVIGTEMFGLLSGVIHLCWEGTNYLFRYGNDDFRFIDLTTLFAVQLHEVKLQLQVTSVVPDKI